MLKRSFGRLPDGREVDLYTLSSDKATVRIMTRGAAIVDFIVDGVNIVGGFDTIDGYLADKSHQGAVIGRVANRVAGAKFTMDGQEYALEANNNGNCLHSGSDSFDKRLFTVTDARDDRVTFRYVSENGDQGFPATLDLKVTYRLSGRALMIHYEAKPDGRTPIALTNHSYFNLDGFGGTVDGHFVKIYADRYTEVNENLIPTGEHPEVENTPLDLTEPVKLGDRFSDTFGGFDHNYVLRRNVREDVMGYELALAAEVSNGVRRMKVYTDQPGVQFYTANALTGEPDLRGGVKKAPHIALCLETQTEPDAINRGIGFYGKGDVYRHTTVYEICDPEPVRKP